MMTEQERRRFWILVVTTFVLTVLEVGSLISILPFLQLLANPELMRTVPALAWVYEAGGFSSDNGFMIAAGVVVFLLTVFGLTLKVLVIWMTTRFAMMRSYSFSARLLANYLHQPYTWFLSRHSSDLGNAILAEVNQVVVGALLPAMRMIPEFFAVALLIALLFIVEPEIAIGGAVLLGGVYGLIFFAVRKVLLGVGEVQLKENQMRFHIVQEATGGVKELKIMGLEDSFLDRFRHSAYRLARAQTLGQVIGAVPRQAIEAVAFGGMLVLVLFLLVRGDGDIASLVPTLGLIAAVGLRLIPALQQVYLRGTSLRQSEPRLKHIHADMTQLIPESADIRDMRAGLPDMPLTETLELKDVRYSYPGGDRSALGGVDLTIPANTTIGIVGGTGAGKTTLVDIILGLLDPDAGQLIVDGTPLSADFRRSWQRTLGYVPQVIFLSDSSLAENIAFGIPKEQIDHEAVEKAARIAALHDFVMTELPEKYDTMVGERGVRLSGGQRQRVGIARALYHDPALLIFDEATSALDSITEAAVMDAVHRIAGQKTILMIAHRLTTVRECDQIFLLRHGQVAAAGTFDHLIKTDEEFRKMAAGIDSGRSG